MPNHQDTFATRESAGNMIETDSAKPRGGFYSMSKRTHVLVGIVYLLLGAGLMATSFGWNPWHDSAEPATKKPSGLPVDKLPKH